MHPALSVILFTTLSGAGYGLLAWLGASTAMFALRGPVPAGLERLQLAALALGLGMSTLGLLFSLGHLGQPQRAWRALSQWRTSWLSREGVMAMLVPVPAVAMGALWLGWLAFGATQAPVLALLGLLLAALCAVTVACTAMIYASLTPIPAWGHRLVVPVYLAFALLTGLCLFALLAAVLLGGTGQAGMLPVLALFGAMVAALKWIYWRDLATLGLPVGRGDAIGLPGRTPTVFERPHTEANYITREMAFVVARTHAYRLRWLATLGILGVPLLAWGLSTSGLAPPSAALALAAAGTLLGAFVERWLFFAEARHVVTLYY